jgi:hypothetical protein
MERRRLSVPFETIHLDPEALITAVERAAAAQGSTFATLAG